jgi:hypothetical protein
MVVVELVIVHRSGGGMVMMVLLMVMIMIAMATGMTSSRYDSAPLSDKRPPGPS